MENQSSGIFTSVGGLVYLTIFIVVVAGLWKLFKKADKPGWAALIPVYNLIVMFEIVGKPLWQLILFIVPFANVYVIITLYLGLARSYGKYGFGNRALVTMFGIFTLAAWGFAASASYVGPSEGPNAVDASDSLVPAA